MSPKDEGQILTPGSTLDWEFVDQLADPGHVLTEQDIR